jgi:hypothetical protein
MGCCGSVPKADSPSKEQHVTFQKGETAGGEKRSPQRISKEPEPIAANSLEVSLEATAGAPQTKIEKDIVRILKARKQEQLSNAGAQIKSFTMNKVGALQVVISLDPNNKFFLSISALGSYLQGHHEVCKHRADASGAEGLLHKV